MKKGMIRVNVIYLNAEGKNFDMEYYISNRPNFTNTESVIQQGEVM